MMETLRESKGTRTGHLEKITGRDGDINKKYGDVTGTFNLFPCPHRFARLRLAPHPRWGQKPLMLFSLFFDLYPEL